MDIPDLGDITFTALPPCEESLDYTFNAKRAALGPYIVERWGWDEAYQRREHRRRFDEKPFSKIVHWGRDIGTVTLMRQDGHIRFGEFYLFPEHQGAGLGTAVLRHCLGLADGLGMPVRLEYLKWNPVGSLYKRHGFVVIGETDIHWQMERRLAPPDRG